MLLKATINYSPNFNIKKRSKKSIKFLIFHYTGMKREQEAIQRLTNIQSEVASHYMIKDNGKIIIFLRPISLFYVKTILVNVMEPVM